MNSQHINALGNILNFSFGKANKNLTYSLQGEVLTLKYTTIVHFASESSLHTQARSLADESMQFLNSAVKQIKEEFKLQTGETIKVSEVANRDDIELISATSNSPRKIAYYKRFVDLKVSL